MKHVQPRPASGKTAPYAVLGHPIGHTLSPIMQQAAMDAMGMDARYLAFDVAPDRLPDVIQAMHAMGFNGVNLTVPLKEVAFRNLTALDADAARLGAVNTLVRTPDGWCGHNTDGDGFLAALREAFDIAPEGRSVFVFGAGGAGRAVALTCAVHGARRIVLADLDPERAEKVASDIRRDAPATEVTCVPPADEEARSAAHEADLVLQASPVGMQADDAPVFGADVFRDGQWFFDLVYMYPETVTMRAAAAAGARTANGLGMLLHQGALALRLWTGRHPPVEVMRQALEQAVYGCDTVTPRSR